MTAERSDRQFERGTGPAVTIVVPTHDRPATLRRAVETVFDQTFDDWQLIVVDDASTCDVAAALDPYLDDPRMCLIRRPTNGGAAAARNTGVAGASGRFVCFLDDDDTYLPGKLVHQVPALDDAPQDVAAVGGRLEITSGKRADAPPAELRREGLLLLEHGNLQLGALLFRRSVVAEIGFDESLTVIDDWELQIRILERHRIICEDVPVARWHDHDGPRLTKEPSFARDWEAVHDRFLPEIRVSRAAHAKWHKKIALGHLHLGNVRHGRRHLITSLRIAPWDARQWLILSTSLLGPERRSRLMARYAALARRRDDLVRRVRSTVDARAG